MSFYIVQVCPTCHTCHFGWHAKTFKDVMHVIFSWTPKDFATKFIGRTTSDIFTMTCYDTVVCDTCGSF